MCWMHTHSSLTFIALMSLRHSGGTSTEWARFCSAAALPASPAPLGWGAARASGAPGSDAPVLGAAEAATDDELISAKVQVGLQC